jgi:hypothetical protein
MDIRVYLKRRFNIENVMERQPAGGLTFDDVWNLFQEDQQKVQRDRQADVRD